MHPSRVRPFAAVCASGVPAPIIDSRNGSAMVTPAPRRNVRRETCLLVKNAMADSPTIAQRELRALLLHFHLKRGAFDDAEDERREPVVVLRRTAHDRPDG